MAAREWLVVYLKGVAMGSADAVPGVSGGTIALITGIYGRLVGAIASLEVREFLALVGPAVRSPVDASARRTVWRALSGMDVPFLLVLAFGLLSDVVTVANLVQYALVDYPVATYAFFFGLVLASVVVLVHEVSLATPGRIAAGVVGFALSFLVSGAGQGSLPANPVVTFLVGALAICAMVLPGISGALILLTLGEYDRMTGAVHAATAAAVSADPGALVAPVATLVVFALGALVGLLTFARVVDWAFEHYHAATLTFLVALMLGALRAPARLALANVQGFDGATLALLVVPAVVGGLLVVALERVSGGVDY